MPSVSVVKGTGHHGWLTRGEDGVPAKVPTVALGPQGAVDTLQGSLLGQRARGSLEPNCCPCSRGTVRSTSCSMSPPKAPPRGARWHGTGTAAKDKYYPTRGGASTGSRSTFSNYSRIEALEADCE